MKNKPRSAVAVPPRHGKTAATMEKVKRLPNNKTREMRAAAELVKSHLKRGKDSALTMRALAKKLRCSKGAAERRFNEYVRKYLPQDQKLKSVPVREGERGPEAIGFYL